MRSLEPAGSIGSSAELEPACRIRHQNGRNDGGIVGEMKRGALILMVLAGLAGRADGQVGIGIRASTLGIGGEVGADVTSGRGYRAAAVRVVLVGLRVCR